MASKQRQCQDTRQHLTELRIVLLGGRNSGKSCVGNAIICVEEFVTRERTSCLRRCAEVLGRHVTVIDTPGWWCDFNASDTPELVKREIVCSVSLSYPGPHIFLIVIKLDSVFTEKRRRAVQEHVELLGEAVWSHTCIFFTRSDPSNNGSVEDRIKTAGGSLQWILEKCGDRYMFLDRDSESAIAQSAKFLSRIEMMTQTVNGGHHFEMDKCILQQAERRRQQIVLEAQQRLLKVKCQTQPKDPSNASERLGLVLLGARGSGKSSVGSTILCGQAEFDRKRRTAACATRTCHVAGRRVTLVDTPGWWMNYYAQDSPKSLRDELMWSAQLCPPGPLCFLLVVRVDKAFTTTYARAFKEHVELLGKTTWGHCMVVFSFGDWLGDTTIEQYIESEGSALQWLVERCGNRYHVMNNKSKGDGFQVSVMLEKIEDMLGRSGGCYYEVTEETLKRLEEQRTACKERARERTLRVKIQRQVLRSLVEVIKPPTDLRITLLGGKQSGKSSAGNTILNREEFEVGCQDINADFIEKKGIVSGRDVSIVKVPAQNSMLHKRSVTGELSPHSGGHGVLLLVLNCSCSFGREELRATAARLSLLGGQLWPFALVLFTNGDWLGDTTIEQYIESEGEALGQLLELCGHRYHVLDNKAPEDRSQVDELLDKIAEMQVLLRLRDQQHKDAVDASLKVLSAHTENMEANTNATISEESMLEIPAVEQAGDLLRSGTSGCSGAAVMATLQQTAHQPAATALEPLIAGDTGTAVVESAAHLDHDGRRSMVHSGGGCVVITVPEWLRSGAFPGLGSWGSSRATPLSTDGSVMWFAVSAHVSQRQAQMLRAGEEGALCLEYGTQNTNTTSCPNLSSSNGDLKDKFKSVNLQALIDDWGDGNIEELEALIDSCTQMFLQESVGSAEAEPDSPGSCSSTRHVGLAEACHDVLSSLDRKLSKLDLIEELQQDLKALKSMLGQCSQVKGYEGSGEQSVESSCCKDTAEMFVDNND